MPTANAKLVIRTLALRPRAVEALAGPQLALELAIVSVRKTSRHLSPPAHVIPKIHIGLFTAMWR